MEMYYVDHASVWLDVKILFKTVWRVFKGDGV
jgi:lipopolysaccharide/colanic/teichoic acid biosynthesis glycosyltransferase